MVMLSLSDYSVHRYLLKNYNKPRQTFGLLPPKNLLWPENLMPQALFEAKSQEN
jgi:hypothetical protein